MAISRMKKLNIIGFAPDKDKVLKIIQDNELVEITSIKDAPDFYNETETEKEDVEGKINNLDFALEYLSQFEEKKGGMFAGLEQDIINKKSFEDITKKIDIDKTCEEISNIYRRLSEIENEVQHHETIIDGLRQWEKLDIPVEKLTETEYTKRFLAKISDSFYNQFTKEIEECTGHFHEIINKTQDGYNVFFVVYKDCENDVMFALKKANFESIVFEDAEGTIDSIIKKHQGIIQDLHKEREDLNNKSKGFVERINDLRIASDYLNTLHSREDAKSKILSSKYTFIIDGWIPTKSVPSLEKALKEFNDIDIAVRDPEKEEEPPIQYKNKGWASPYEMLVSMYSPPAYRELDPSPIIMPFFTLFFAVCLTDMGYGLIVSLFAFFILKKVPKEKAGFRKMLKVLLFSGLTTVVIGMLTGGIFGINFQGPLKETVLGRFREQVMLFDPGTKQGMMVFFALSLGLGWIHVFAGHTVAFIKKKREEGILSAILDHVSWMVVLFGGLFLGLSVLKPMFKINLVIPPIYPKIGAYLLLGGLGVVFLFGGRREESIIGKMGQGLMEVYGISGLLGDILSYARLFALGLSTGVIAGVFNKLALMLKGIGGVPGWIFFIILLAVGHMFNVAINALGSFIHTLRLQFVEFFGKFYSGGGEEFKPLKRELKYILVEKENIQ